MRRFVRRAAFDPFPPASRKKKAYRAARGDAFAHVTHVLNRRLQRTGKPFDLYGLYRAVTVRGGFGSRPLARRHLNMMQGFREMRNHYDGHTYTDIGTQLLNTYEFYFLDYEQDHPQDVNVSACSRCGRAPPRRPHRDLAEKSQSRAKEATAKEEPAKDGGGDEATRSAEADALDGKKKARPPTPTTALAPFGGVSWAREGVTDADLRVAAAKPTETDSHARSRRERNRLERVSALLPLGWVECDVCRVLTHVACARDGAADVTPGNQVAWFVCDICDAKLRGVDGADGVEATASARATATRRESASAPRRVPAGPSARADRLPREKSPLGSRSRASGTRPVAAPPSKRDRHGREVRPSIATSNLATRALANRDFSNRGEYRPEVSYGAYPNHGTGPSPGMYANEAYACVGEETRAFGSAEVSISARAAYGDRAAYDALRRERESAEAAVAAAAMEMEMERARGLATFSGAPGADANAPGLSLPLSLAASLAPSQTHVSAGLGFRGFPMASPVPPNAPPLPSPASSPRAASARAEAEKALGRRALGSVPGARLRRSNSAQNILNAVQASLPGPPRTGGSPSPAPEEALRVDALTRSASQCSLGAEHFWRGLLGEKNIESQEEPENESVGPEGGGDLFAFA